MRAVFSFTAIGDSFTEGVGDELPDGTVRGWADLVAVGLATAQQQPVQYANFAIRGRKLAGILSEQLDAAIALKPDVLCLNGGGNDIMRPKVSIDDVARDLAAAARRVGAAGIHPVMLSGGNPSKVVPAGPLMQRRGDQLDRAVRAELGNLEVTYVDNWREPALRNPRLWSVDRLHLNAAGHAMVAANVLRALGFEAPDAWQSIEPRSVARSVRGTAYYREHVLPWVGRRLTRRSSGDGRRPKAAEYREVLPLT